MVNIDLDVFQLCGSDLMWFRSVGSIVRVVWFILCCAMCLCFIDSFVLDV